ncbi:MAG: prepilin-type N-terminal cleavage/methylation domain-containing protein [Nitrospiraceae bacterium]|nr:MAG: prepilin-type N-terminal cleavage/methylation domain-containing protein [Nitrospiraceae bacterium]
MIQDTGYRIQDKRHRASCIVHHDSKGITLIELVIVMVLIAIVAVVVANALSTGIDAFFTTDNRKEALDQARVAMDRMAKEIRNLPNSAGVIASGSPQLCFSMLDGTNNPVTVNYSYSNPNIRRESPSAACTPGNGQTLATSITSFSFEYIQADGASAATFSSVTTKRIRITAISTVSNEIVELTTEVWPRNLN